MRRRIGVTTAVALALVLGGCAAGAPGAASPTPATALPDGVTVSFVQLRSDVAARQAQVEIVNGTDDVLTIGSVRVADPRFDGPAVRVVERDSRVAAGSTVDIRVQLPAAACAGAGVDADADAEASVTFDYSTGGESVEVTAPLPDPVGFVAPLHERECRAALLAEAADLAFTGFTPSPAGTPASLELTIRPTGAAGAVIRGIQTTNLLTFGQGAGDTADTHPLDLEVSAADTDAVVVSLPLVPLRCDPHAVQEDKRGTIFTIAVELDGAPGEIELAAPEDLRGRILTWVAAWCGFGG